MVATLGSLRSQVAGIGRMVTGPSSSQEPFMGSNLPGATVTSLLTVGDEVPHADGDGTFSLVGIPDGMGAYDNGDGTFTLLVGHELRDNLGAERTHGGIGSFVSQFVVNKETLEVVSGRDLATSLLKWDGTSWLDDEEKAKSRFCSGELPPTSAFYNAQSGKGTTNRIYMNGEETGPPGMAFAHVIDGDDARTTYSLPHLGRASWENSVASPFAQDKTIVVLLDDSHDGEIYVYVGEKSTEGATSVEKAGLVGGALYGLRIPDKPYELSDGGIQHEDQEAFEMEPMGDIWEMEGEAFAELSLEKGVTRFARPEDGVWDPRPGMENRFYWVTTGGRSNEVTGASRLWCIEFTDINRPELGGTQTILLDSWKPNARFRNLDNMTMDLNGIIYLQEDSGSSSHLARIYA
ncbi:MAG: alkaline phosphatase PhoX, partial [Verrucomicrobiota bacterium]